MQRGERTAMRKLRRPVRAALAGVAAVAIAGCGSSSSSTNSPNSTKSAGSGSAVKGGTATVLEAAGGVDSLDPGYWYFQSDYADLLRTTQRMLYSFTSAGTEPVPDLATAMPVISGGAKTLTIHIRPGIHYSPPLQKQTVTSSDLKYAMERCFLASVGNGYAETYYPHIVGAPAKPVSSLPTISGLQTPDPSTLVINTDQPVGVLTTANALALPCTVPVPQRYASRYDKASTSSYGMHQLFVGPYMIAGAQTGTVPSSGYQSGKLLDLVRNPSWERSTDPLVAAHLDQILFKGGNDVTVASRQTLQGSGMMSGDFAAPPVSILQQGLTSSQRSQFHILPSGNRYIALNSTIPPLNNVDVRRAISAVIDRSALRLTRGGTTLGTLATHFIPPGLPGFAQAGGAKGAGYDFVSDPNGNVAVAEKYMRLAGYKTGRYTGPALLTIADNTAPASNTALAVQSELAQIGFKLNFREIPHATVLSKFCEVPKAQVAICPTLAWGKDFNDSQSMIDPVFNGKNIVPTGNTNMAQANDPALNAQMNAAEKLTSVPARAAAWGKIDTELTNQAYVVTWLWDNEVTFASKNVHGVNWAFNNNTWDLANSWLTSG